MKNPKKINSSVAIFSAREDFSTLEKTISTALQGIGPNSVIDLLVNGNKSLALESVNFFAKNKIDSPSKIRIWFIPTGDKAHTWNEYIYKIWPGSKYAHFIDGYARMWPMSIKLLETAMNDAPGALGATGIPTNGRTAKSLSKNILLTGGIHGNLYSLKFDTIKKIISKKFYLPIGIYRTDSTLGAALAFGLDPASITWNMKARIVTDAQASWDLDDSNIFSIGKWKSILARRIRQSQGKIENLAVREIFRDKHMPVGALPKFAVDLIEDWIKRHPAQVAILKLTDPFLKISLRRALKKRDWPELATPPQLLFEN